MGGWMGGVCDTSVLFSRGSKRGVYCMTRVRWEWNSLCSLVAFCVHGYVRYCSTTRRTCLVSFLFDVLAFIYSVQGPAMSLIGCLRGVKYVVFLLNFVIWVSTFYKRNSRLLTYLYTHCYFHHSPLLALSSVRFHSKLKTFFYNRSSQP